LDIIVIDLFSVGGFPLEGASDIDLRNLSALSGVILVTFWYYCGVVLDILLLICYFWNFFWFYILLYLEYYKWYERTFLGRKLWVNFF
jgi:hypothetical protein